MGSMAQMSPQQVAWVHKFVSKTQVSGGGGAGISAGSGPGTDPMPPLLRSPGTPAPMEPEPTTLQMPGRVQVGAPEGINPYAQTQTMPAMSGPASEAGEAVSQAAPRVQVGSPEGINPFAQTQI